MSLRDIRYTCGMTQPEAAKASGIAQKTLSFIESGKHKPRAATLRKLSECYGVPVQELAKAVLEQEGGVKNDT